MAYEEENIVQEWLDYLKDLSTFRIHVEHFRFHIGRPKHWPFPIQ